MKRSLALACLGLIVAACSSKSTNEGAGGGGGTGGASGSGGTGGGTGGSGGAMGGTGATAGATGGTAGATGGAAGATGGSAGTDGGATGGTGGTTGGTGGTTGGAGGTGGVVNCPTGCNCDGACDTGESAACLKDCGNTWRFVDTDVSTGVTIRGDMTLTPSGSVTWSNATKNDGSAAVCSACSFNHSTSGLDLTLSGNVASGGVASTGDVMVATYQKLPRQLVAVRKPTTTVTNQPVKSITYRMFGLTANNTTDQFGLAGTLMFDSNACLPTSATNTSSTGMRINADGTGKLPITFWGYGLGQAKSGCMTVSADGSAKLDHMQTSPAAPSGFNGVFEGWMSPTGEVILLTRAKTAGGFDPGTIILVKQALSGMTLGKGVGKYYVSHLLGGSTKLGVRGYVTYGSTGVVTSGALRVNGGTSDITVYPTSKFSVSAQGGFWTILDQSNSTTGHMVGQLQPAGTGIVTHKVAGPTPTYTSEIDGASLMVWVR